MRLHPLVLLLSLTASTLGACMPARSVVYSAPVAAADPGNASGVVAGQPTASVASADRHVVIISIDGLRPDAIDRFGATAIKALMREGSYSLNARTILPSLTLPSHTSMLTGVGPEVHGITWNDNQVEYRGRVEVPTILESARAHGMRTAAIVSKGKLNHLLAPGTADYFVVPEGNGSWSAGRTAREVEEHLSESAPNLLFVHLREPDRYGHVFGWMGRMYGWAVRRADEGVARILASADEAFGRGNYTVILTADHGGHGRVHGSADASSQEIPWIVAGRGVTRAGELPDGIRTMDTAATALWLLGIPIPESYAGVPVRAAFGDAAVAARPAPVAPTN